MIDTTNTVKPFARYDLRRGFIDPNGQFGPIDLYGQGPYRLGLYYQMRQAGTIVRQCMDARHKALRQMSYEVRPRTDEPTPAQVAAAETVGRLLNNMRHRTLSSLVAEVDDRVASFGHASAQIVSDGDRIDLIFVEPYQVREWLTDPSRVYLRGLLYDSGEGWHRIDAPQLVWFGNESEAGNLWGSAELRGLLAYFVAFVQEMQLHLFGRTMEAGIPYTQAGADGAAEPDVTKSIEWLSRWYSGNPAPAHFPLGITPHVLSVENKASARTKDMFEHYNAVSREFCGAMIGSLADSGTGSRALGEAMSDADATKMIAHAQSACDLISGVDSPNIRFIRTLCEWSGFAPEDAPVIALVERPAGPKANRTADFIALVNAGVWPSDRVTEDQRQALIEDLGLPYSEPEPVEPAPVVTLPEPANV
jgi:hypothetical protein